jgi:hypothetical protein
VKENIHKNLLFSVNTVRILWRTCLLKCLKTGLELQFVLGKAPELLAWLSEIENEITGQQ